MENGSGAKAFGGIVALVAVIAGVYAMVEPQSQRMDFLSSQLLAIEKHMALDDKREREDQGQFSATAERFKEVETQFTALQHLMAVQFKHTDRDIFHLQGEADLIERWRNRIQALDATQSEKIRTLERMVYGETQ